MTNWDEFEEFVTLMLLLKIKTKYRAFSTAVGIKPVPFWVVVFEEFSVPADVSILERHTNNLRRNYRITGP